MSADVSREALAAIIGEDLMADIERRAALAPAAPPEIVAQVRRILAPTVNRMAANVRTLPVRTWQEAA